MTYFTKINTLFCFFVKKTCSQIHFNVKKVNILPRSMAILNVSFSYYTQHQFKQCFNALEIDEAAELYTYGNNNTLLKPDL